MKSKYVLVTPAHNEEELIEGAIKSVIAQTILPQKWIIVDDNSTDSTAEIIKYYESRYDFITYLRLKREDIESYYSRRVWVVMAGYEKIGSLEYDFLGVLDADIELEPKYYEGILREFDSNPRLGIAAGIFLYEVNGHLEEPLMDESCTPGSHHVFRRGCYEEIGGYIPLKHGGDDSMVDIMARMHGWETRSFKKHGVIQRRFVGTGDGKSMLQARFRQGLTEYGIATHPLFMLAKSIHRAVLEKPYIMGGLARLAGFLYGYWLREERKIPSEAVQFVRKEQLGRLLAVIKRSHPASKP
jgi:biofilm PGA synthesis N-glycosyltransferase PgaC